ncbi:hypothetical protein LCGC14_2947990, partial [marine sediment metagenome]
MDETYKAITIFVLRMRHELYTGGG